MEMDSVDRMIQEWADTDPKVNAQPLEVVGRLLLCAHHLQHELVAALKPFELSFGDFDVINTLRRREDKQGTNPGALARSLLITSGAMTAGLDRLEQADLIVRIPDITDGRGVRVLLTGRGETVAEQALQAVIAADLAFLEPLGQRQRDTVATALKVLLLRYESP